MFSSLGRLATKLLCLSSMSTVANNRGNDVVNDRESQQPEESDR